MTDRPTLRQLAQQSAGSDPWACRVCGCRNWDVYRTVQRLSYRKRERVCRNCGNRIITAEVPVDEPRSE